MASTSSPRRPRLCGQMWIEALRKFDRDSRQSAINIDRRNRDTAAVDISWINRIIKQAGIMIGLDMQMNKPFRNIPRPAKADDSIMCF